MSEKITFQELIDSIADKTDNSKKFTHDFLKDFADVINSGLEEDGKVNIAGLGKFGLRRVDERDGYNPQTGESMTIPAHNKIIFKPYKELRERVNAPYIDMESEIIEDEKDTGPAEGKDEQDQQKFIPTAPPPAIEDEKSGSEDHSDEEKEDSFTKPFQETTSSKFAFDEEGDNDPTDFYNEDIVEYKDGQEETFDEDLEAFISGKTPGKEKDDHTFPVSDEEYSEEEPAPLESDPAAFSPLESDHTRQTEDQADSEPAPQPEFPQKSGRGKKTDNKSILMAAAVIILLLVAGSGYILIQSQQENNGGPEQASSAATAVIDQNQENDADQRAQQQDAEQQPEQSQQADRRESQQTEENRSVVLEITQDQTLWSMAENRYNNPYLWPWIYDANKSSIEDPDLIIAGQTLTVPIPSGAQNTLTSGDSLEVAVGYIETYKWYKNKGMDNARLYLRVAANYDEDILNQTDFEIDKDDLAFANRSQVQ